MATHTATLISLGCCLAVNGEQQKNLKIIITCILAAFIANSITAQDSCSTFYPFENGKIIVNNQHNLPKVNTEDWRNIIGIIPQEITIFSGNVVSNILLGKEDTLKNIQKFCEKYGFTEFVNSLPQGFATILGEEGVNLSGGQKQIIALARVLYKKPQLLILDEATAAMDRKTEKFSIELVSKLKKEMAVLFISHRLETLKKYADRIFVLENGETIVQGNHQQLLETSNFYSDYWKELV